MLEHYKQLTRQLNTLKTKNRYRERRKRRAYLTEAYLDGELALYKPFIKTPIDMMQEQQGILNTTHPEGYTQCRCGVAAIREDLVNRDEPLYCADCWHTDCECKRHESIKPTTFNWFEKLLLKIKNIFKVKR